MDYMVKENQPDKKSLKRKVEWDKEFVVDV